MLDQIKVETVHRVLLAIGGFLFGGGLMLLVLALVSADIPQLATFYVATTGGNSNSGSETQPFQTVNNALTVLKPGDTFLIKSGTYREWLNWGASFPAETSWNPPITVKVFPEDFLLVKIRDGFIIDGQHKAYHGFQFMPDAKHLRAQNSEIKNAARTGTLVAYFDESLYGTH